MGIHAEDSGWLVEVKSWSAVNHDHTLYMFLPTIGHGWSNKVIPIATQGIPPEDSEAESISYNLDQTVYKSGS